MVDDMDSELVELIRKRPAMYVGSTDTPGLVATYFGCTFGLLLGWGATRISIDVREGFRFLTDAVLPSRPDGIGAFDVRQVSLGDPELFAGTINALSRELTVSQDGRAVSYVRGVCTDVSEDERVVADLEILAVPDEEIFSVASVPDAIPESLLTRLAFLCPKCRFTLVSNKGKQSFHSPDGMMGMFRSVSVPYQLLHEPFQLENTGTESNLEMVFAFHSGRESLSWCFVNGNRTTGGTIHSGLRKSFGKFREKVFSNSDSSPGIIAAIHLRNREAMFGGPDRSEVYNQEFEAEIIEAVGQTLKRINLKELSYLASIGLGHQVCWQVDLPY